MTLQVSAGDWSLSAPNSKGRSKIVGVADAHSLADPGHALLPAWSTMLAVPNDARPSVRVLQSDAPVRRDGVKLAIAGRPDFRTFPDGSDAEPIMLEATPLADGAWPTEPVRIGTPTPFRGRKLLSIEVRPFRYDEVASQLTVTPGMTVRVDFNRPAGAAALAQAADPAAADRHYDDVLAASVLNFEQAKPWRSAPRGAQRLMDGLAAGGVSPETEPEVRVKVDSTALYTLPYELLVAKGYPAGVAIANVAVHRHEYVEGQAAPYVTVDVPCEVEDANSNGTFDGGDRIWVYVRKWSERSNASQYQRFWGESEVIYVTRDLSGGARMPKRGGWRNATLTPLPSFPYKEHFEKNFSAFLNFIQSPYDTTLDLYQWNENQLYYSRPDTLKFVINDIDTSRTVTATLQYVGLNAGSHFVWAAVKNGLNQVSSLADSVYWNNKSAVTVSRSVRGSAFTSGVNSFRGWGKSYNAPPDPVNNALCRAGLNWFDLTYWRRYSSVHDYLAFNSGEAAGEFQIHVTGFLGDSIRLYDVTNPEAPQRVLLDPAHVALQNNYMAFDFQDSTASTSPKSYVAAFVQDPVDPAFGPKVPPAANFTAVTRRNLYANTAGDWLLVVPEAFLPAMQPLVDLRVASGLNVVVAPLESVNDEFNGGRHSGASVQRFVRWAYEHWQSRFLLLFGDGNMDPMNYRRTSGRDWVPVLPTAGPVPVSEFELIPSDNSYAYLTGEKDPIYGSGDVIPEMMVGRIPVNTLAEAQGVVAKLVQSENLTGDQSWRRRMLLSSDDAFSGDSFFGGGGSSTGYCFRFQEQHFVELNAKSASILQRDAGLAQLDVDLFNLRWYLANEPYDMGVTIADTCRPDRAATRTRTHATVTPVLFDKLNAGVSWWNYQGHASEWVLTHEDLYVNDTGLDDKSRFANLNKYFFFSAFSCHANMFARPEKQFGSQGPALGEEFVTLPNAGAIGSWASVSYEIVPRDDSSHVNVELARAMSSAAVHDNILSDRGARLVLGEAIQNTFLRFVPTVFSYSYERGVASSYTLLGDPASRMSIGQPQTLVYANDVPLVNDQPIRLHTPGDTLTLVADLVSTARLDSLGLYRESNGTTTPVPATAYALTPAFPDTAGGGVWGGKRFRLTWAGHTQPQTETFVLRARDRDGLTSQFRAVFSYDVTLRADGAALHDGDAISPVASLSLLVQSPAPFDPVTDLTLALNGASVAFTAVPAPGDASGREWIVSWVHGEYAKDDYVLDVQLSGAPLVTRRFKVTVGTGELKLADLVAFPNPFGNEGTLFSFLLLGSEPADVKITILTVSGRPIRSIVVRGVTPGYHQVPWDANDSEGDAIANGVYFYRVSAQTGGGAHVQQLGRLVKLRPARHVDFASTP
ncbi:MAG: C25 family cysteine peptidase [Candidatus Eisenbacteria bacterium]